MQNLIDNAQRNIGELRKAIVSGVSPPDLLLDALVNAAMMFGALQESCRIHEVMHEDLIGLREEMVGFALALAGIEEPEDEDEDEDEDDEDDEDEDDEAAK